MTDQTRSGGKTSESVRSLAEAVIARHEAELLDLQIMGGDKLILRLIVDQPEGISLDTCAKISNELSRLLDAEDPIQDRYNLEVSSPGADRSLRTEKDFRRNIGRPLRIQTLGAHYEGTLDQVEPDRVHLTGAGSGTDEWIAIADVTSAKVVLPW